MRYRNTLFAFAAIAVIAGLIVFFSSNKIDIDAAGEEIPVAVETEDGIVGQAESEETLGDEGVSEPEAEDVSETESTQAGDAGNAEGESSEPDETDATEPEESGDEIARNEVVVQEKESREEVILRYEPEFDTLENEAERAIDALIEKAKEEYYSVEEADRTLGFKLELANKYLKKGNELEENFDVRFYDLLSELEYELKNNEYETSVLKEIEAAYKLEKTERRKALISKAMDKM